MVRPDQTDAERHLEALWSLLDDATAVEGLVSVVSASYVERFGEYVADGLDADLVLSADGEVVAIELRDGGLVTGIVVNDTPDAVRWARATIAQYRRDAERVV